MDVGDKRNGGAVIVDKSPLKVAIVLVFVSTKAAGQEPKQGKWHESG